MSTNNFSVLALTDGTPQNRIQLVQDSFGFHLQEWPMSVPVAKDGGVWHDSKLAQGKRLVMKRWTNPTEVMTLSVNGSTQSVISNMQNLRRLLEQAVQYWTTNWQTQPVWIEAQSAGESYMRYALVMDYSLTGETNPYAPPFFGNQVVAFEAIGLAIERGPWLSNVPGSSTCVPASNSQPSRTFNGWTIVAGGYAACIIEMKYNFVGRIVAGDTQRTYWSDDLTPHFSTLSIGDGSTIPRWFAENPTYLYCVTDAGLGGGGIFESSDGGATWTIKNNAQRATKGSTMVYCPKDGYLYLASTDFRISRSNDRGVTWTMLTGSPISPSYVQCLWIDPITSTLYSITSTGAVFKSLNGTTWTAISTIPIGVATLNPTCFTKATNGYYYIVLNNQMWRSRDLVSWARMGLPVTTYPTHVISVGDFLYATANTGIMKAFSNDLSFATFVDSSSALNYQLLLRSYDNKIYSASYGSLFKDSTIIGTVGQESTCNQDVVIMNKKNLAQLTNGYYYDASATSWTSVLPAGSFPQLLLPAIPAAGDILYVGIQYLNLAIFNNLVFNLVGGRDITIVIEYSNGAGGWPAFTTTISRDNTFGLTHEGVQTIIWSTLAGHNHETVHGIDAYWVRFRVSAIGANPIPPYQQTRDVYTCLSNFVEVASTVVLGDLPAMLRTQLYVLGDTDGGTTALIGCANRYLIGLRSIDRGKYFEPFLNFVDLPVSMPMGITMAGTAATVAASSLQTSTFRKFVHTGTGTSTWADQFTWTLSAGLAPNFYGRFRVFLRAQQSNGAAGDVRVRFKVVYGLGGLNSIGDYATFAGNDDWQLLDLGSAVFPPTSITPSDLGDQMQFVLQIWSSAARTVNLYDLALVPTDEWSGDFVDSTLANTSGVGNGDQLDVDSVSLFRSKIRALVRTSPSDVGAVTNVFQPITASPQILQSNETQRLYVLSARYSSGVWYSEPWIAHSAKLQAAFQYLSMRGSR